MGKETEYECMACGRKFLATPEEVGVGHLCLAADEGLSQREALEELKSRAGAR